MRTLIFYLYFWLYQLAMIPKFFRVRRLDQAGDIEERDRVVADQALTWGRNLVNLTGSEIEVIGEENIPKDSAVVFVANHQGAFDIPLLLGFIKKPKAFISKVEVKKLPMIGRWMEYMNCVFIERGNPREALKSINKGAEVVKSGYSLVLFPEGTRSDDGALLPFKPGSMKIAIKSKAPIIPVTIIGTKNIMKKNSIVVKPAKVKIVIDKPLNPGDYKTNEISESLWTIIAKNLGQEKHDLA